MNTKKQDSKKSLETPNSKLQKSSVIFMQLGLILALLTVYVTLEHKSLVKYATYIVDTSSIIDEPAMPEIIIERKKIKVIPKKILPKIKKPIIKKTPKDLIKINIVDNLNIKKETKTTTTEIEPNEKVEPKQNPLTVDKIVKPKVITTGVNHVEIVPTFPGCKGSNEQKKACLNKKMRKHIQKYFNSNLVNNLGLDEGKQRISVGFIIDEKGNVVEIKTRAVHKKLEKEALRIMKKLPKMIPGQQNKTQVRVRYNLPINIEVEY